jgi:hypothetical protein
MTSEVPFIDAPDFQFEISLDGIVYLMRLRWNHIANAWFMDLSTRARTPLVFGTKLVAKCPLLAEQAGDLIPKGEFYVVGEPTDFYSFLKAQAQLLYYTEDEMNAF